MIKLILTASLIIGILAVNVYKAGEKVIDTRNQEIEKIYELLEIK